MRFLSLSAGLSALLACPVWAAQWDIVPTLSVIETYTDNVSLAPAALKRNDWVTQAIPAVSVAATGARLKLNARYAPEATYYAHGTQDNDVFHRGNALGVAELAERLLFLEAGANANQYNISPRGAITTSNVNVTGNRATVVNYYASPYLRHSGPNIRGEARFTYSEVHSGDAPQQLVNSQSGRSDLRLASGPAYTLLTGDLAYRRENIRYDETPQETDIEVSRANARLRVTSTVGLLAQAGYDYYRNGDFIPVSEGISWGGGADWTPSPRTHLAAIGGKRFYGNFYNLDFRHRTRLTTWGASYTHDVTTTRSVFFIPATTSTGDYLDTLFSSRFPDPVERQKVVQDFIARTGLPPSLDSSINFFTSQLFLARRWQASTGILGVRNVVIANVFGERREGLEGDLVLPFAPDATRQIGTNVVWNWLMTARSTWNLGAGYSRIEAPGTGQSDRVVYGAMSLTRQFQPKVVGSLGYRRQEKDSNFSAAGYTENAGYASLRVQF